MSFFDRAYRIADNMGIIKFFGALSANATKLLISSLFLMAAFENDITKSIHLLLLGLIFMVYDLREYIYKMFKSDSPTPQNWVFFRVIVRGEGHEYNDFIIVQNLEDHFNQIKDYYAKKNEEVVEIFTCYISARI